MPVLDDQHMEHLRRIKEFAPLAESRGVPGAVMVAQGTIESGWGRSGLSRKGNAFFGVKARAGWSEAVYSGTTREWEGGRSVIYRGTGEVYPSYAAAIAAGVNPVALFRAYPSFEDNVRDYLEFFHRNPRYAPALLAYLQHRDPFEFAALIHKAGYATSPTYTRTLHGFMRMYVGDLLAPKVLRVMVNDEALPLGTYHVDPEGRVFVHVRTLVERLGLPITFDREARIVKVG